MVCVGFMGRNNDNDQGLIGENYCESGCAPQLNVRLIFSFLVFGPRQALLLNLTQLTVLPQPWRSLVGRGVL
jgi:hypothetical protein